MTSLHPALATVKPKAVARYFDAIRKIPRLSGHEGQILHYLRAWARQRGLTYRIDTVGNIAIDAPGAEGHPRILLQAHMDMVAVQVPGCAHDFLKDPIPLERRGDLVASRGNTTSIGADNGLGLAIALAVLETGQGNHPPLTLLVTVDEEQGMTGALNIGEKMVPENLAGLINLDAIDGPGSICSGSAAGLRFEARWGVAHDWVGPAAGHHRFLVQVAGLKGGHSGIDIHRNRGHAIGLLIGLIGRIQKTAPDLALERLEGGERSNALPREAHALIHVPGASVGAVRKILQSFKQETRKILGHNGRHLKIDFKKTGTPEGALSPQAARRFLSLLKALPNGVIEADRDGETLMSSSIGLIRWEADTLIVECLARYAPKREKAFKKKEDRMRAGFKKSGATLTEHRYSGWQEPENSRLLVLARNVSRAHGHKVKAFSHHAGLELTTVKDRLRALGHEVEKLSCIAIGPYIHDPHSPFEAFQISTVEPTYELLREILKELAG